MTSLTEYYSNEIFEWRNTMELYIDEIESTEALLNECIHSDKTFTDMVKTEAHRRALLNTKQSIRLHLSTLSALEADLYQDHIPLEDAALPLTTRQQINGLRNKIFSLFSNYVRWKQDCCLFLEEAIYSQQNFVPYRTTKNH
ncbi:MAG: hypothetical protein ACXWV0_08065 [Flavisolibacter sp.]